MKVEYQIGVDVLGFPMYMVHEISTGQTKGSKFHSRVKKWITVSQRIVKQF